MGHLSLQIYIGVTKKVIEFVMLLQSRTFQALLNGMMNPETNQNVPAQSRVSQEKL